MFSAAQLEELFKMLFDQQPSAAATDAHTTAPSEMQRRPDSATAATAAAGDYPVEAGGLPLVAWHRRTVELRKLALALSQLPPSQQAGSSPIAQQGQQGLQLLTSSLRPPSPLAPAQLDSAAAVSWLLTNEAARQFIAARLRTHLGPPPQTLAALEQMLHAALQRLVRDGPSAASPQRAWHWEMRVLLSAQQRSLNQHARVSEQQGTQMQQQQQPHLLQPQQLLMSLATMAAGPHVMLQHQQQSSSEDVGSHLPPDRQRTPTTTDVDAVRLKAEAGARCLLDFLWSLEVAMLAAAEGSLSRAAPLDSAATFFSGNRKVWASGFRV